MKRIPPFLAAMVFLAPSSAWACPTCKDGLHDGTALGYAISILFMMGMPFVILTFWTVMIMRLRAAAQRVDSGIQTTQLASDRVSSASL